MGQFGKERLSLLLVIKLGALSSTPFSVDSWRVSANLDGKASVDRRLPCAVIGLPSLPAHNSDPRPRIEDLRPGKVGDEDYTIVIHDSIRHSFHDSRNESERGGAM